MSEHKLLIINPGSTSTKIALYEDETPIFTKILRHEAEEISKFKCVIDQTGFRKKHILDFLEENNVDLSELSAVVGRGGLLKPVVSGTYEVNEYILRDLRLGDQGEHASNLGAILAKEIADSQGIPSYIVDPVVVDEMTARAKFTGFPGIQRKSVFHALNQKAVARRYAKEHDKAYTDINLIVVHMGGGISVGAHRKGRIIDVNNAVNGDGPLSPERSGSIPAAELVKICFRSGLTEEQVMKKLNGQGGMVAYLHTSDARDVIEMDLEGNPKAKLVIDAFCYQVAKSIGKCSTVLKGDVQAIIFTGGIAYSDYIISKISERVDWIAPIVVYPGEDEMLALAQGALRVLNGEEQAKEYF